MWGGRKPGPNPTKRVNPVPTILLLSFARTNQKTLNELHLFAGAGGGILGGILCGHRPVCAVEIERYNRALLLQRQRDGILPWFPVWDDVTTFDGKPWEGIADVVCGGFPCQDISAAGKGAGIEGERSGLWGHMARIIGEIRPRFVFVENSPLLVRRGLAVVLGDLAKLGYDARWGVLGASHIGAAHHRERLWVVAYAPGEREHARNMLEACRGWRTPLADRGLPRLVESQQWRPSSLGAHSESGLCGLADGVADKVDRLRATGNGQVPGVAALAWNLLR
jgi:DNA (cytosine-5)-methyltransferase 1